jgi:RHS repeat-associated protein
VTLPAGNTPPGKSRNLPDVARLGGTVGADRCDYQVITLPIAAVNQLRAHASVAYVQRVWMGEPLSTWKEDAATPPTRLRVETDSTPDGAPSFETGTYVYDGSGNIRLIGNDTYAYDAAGRLKQATVGGVVQTYQYDSFGNMVGMTSGGTATPMPTVDSNSNRLSGMSYRTDTTQQNRRYIYTPDEERLAVKIGSQTLYRWKIRDINSSAVLREFDYMDFRWVEDYVYAEGELVAGEREAIYGGKRHFHSDHLGTTRLITGENRMRYGRHDFYPFGVEQTSSVQEETNFGFVRADPMKFTGHERDFQGVTNVENTDYVDYMHARFYNPPWGRFLSVDPIPGEVRDPQSWNAYAYVQGNPVSNTDPQGLTLYANTPEAQREMCTLVGADCSRYLAFDKDGKVAVTATEADLRNNEALNLFNDMVISNNVYGAWIGTAMPSGGKTLRFGDRTSMLRMVNASKTARTDVPASMNAQLPAGYDGAVGIFSGYAGIATGKDGRPVSLALSLFHELAENYHRTEKVQQYLASHANAKEREAVLRRQRPDFNQYSPGSEVRI